MNDIFFELIRVAIGTQDSLSRLPSARKWGELYKAAKNQSLVGVCFAALQRLGADANEGFARIGMSEMLYLTWMGMTAKIQQKNQTVDGQCRFAEATLCGWSAFVHSERTRCCELIQRASPWT